MFNAASLTNILLLQCCLEFHFQFQFPTTLQHVVVVLFPQLH